MASNRRTLKAYVRYDGTGRVLPGGPILSRFKPKVGNWVEINAYECCNNVGCPGPYWLNFNDDMVDQGYDATNAAIDSSCNTYTAYYYLYDPESSQYISYLQKFNNSGDLVWTKEILVPSNLPFGEGVLVTSAEIINLRVASDDSVYICFSTAVFKMDGNGNILWSKIQGIDDFDYVVRFSGLSLDSNNNVFVQGAWEPNYLPPIGTPREYYVAKLDGATGTILAEKTYYDARLPPSEPYTYGPGYCDNEGNFIGNYNYNISGYTSTVLKFDNSLNLLWTGEVDFPVGEGCDQDLTAIRVLSDNSIIHTSYGGGIHCLNPDGTVKWYTEIAPPHDCADLTSIAVDKRNDDIYFIGEDVSSGGNLTVIKLDKNGNYIWAYDIAPGDSFFSLWDMTSDNAEIQNGTLVIASHVFVLKLPLAELTPGTYGLSTVTNTTSTYSFVQSTPVVNPVTVVESSSTLFSDNLVTPTVTIVDASFTVIKTLF